MKEVTDPNPDARGNIILMHDSGGDRSQTVKLLPVLIDTLRAQGYSFVPVSELGGFTRDQVMPRLPLTVMLYAEPGGVPHFLLSGPVLYYCFIAAIILGVGRLLMLCGLALVNRLRNRPEPAVADDGPRHRADPRLQRGKSHRHHRRADSGQPLPQSGSAGDR